MARVTRADGSTFCIDRFEAHTDGGALGNAQQAANDATLQGDGSTHAAAQLALAATPTTGVSWFQAQAACANAHKRLCSIAEWERACRGSQLAAYPYGGNYNETTCDGFFRFYPIKPAPTGSFATLREQLRGVRHVRQCRRVACRRRTPAARHVTADGPRPAWWQLPIQSIGPGLRRPAVPRPSKYQYRRPRLSLLRR